MSKIIELTGSVHVLGKAEFRVLEGSVFINGRSLNVSGDKLSLFSPRSSALMELEPTSPSVKMEFFELADGLEDIQTCQPNFGNIFAPETETVESFEEIVKGLYMLKGDTSIPVMRITEEWRQVLSDFSISGGDKEGSSTLESKETESKGSKESKESTESDTITSNTPVIFVCGHRKVGKSSFCRFLLNGLLNEHASVDFVDLDPGQTEFTPAGFISRKRYNQQGKKKIVCLIDVNVFIL